MGETKDEAKNYSLWIIPLGSETYGKLATVISNLAGTYGSPDFDPHVTLLGGLKCKEADVKERTKALAVELCSFRVELDGIGKRSERPRAPYLNVKKSPALAEANETARKFFGLGPDPNYHPHISMAYGDFDEKTIQEMQKSCSRCSGISFSADQIFVYLVEGQNSKEIAEFRLPD
jgi:2'-5' RNA ligase